MAEEPNESDLEKYSRSSHESDIDHFPMDLLNDKSRSAHNMSENTTNSDKIFNQNNTDSCTDEADSSPLKDTNKRHNEASFSTNDDIPASPQHGVMHDEVPLSNNSKPKRDSHSKKRSRCGQCCKACKVKCLICCRPCMTEHNPLPDNPSCSEKIKYSCMCPPHGKVARWLTSLLAIVFFYGALWGVTGNEALPGGNFFAIFILFISCVLGGLLVEKIKLPPLLGMLLVGGLLGNVLKIDVAKDIDEDWSSALRSIALVVILTRAGLGLDPKALKKLSFGVIRLAFTPCIVEAVTAAVTSHYILGFPWAWGFMLGFVLAAVSPAVVVPSMLTLTEKGYGVDKGIPTLIIAAASIDDVLAISGFGVVLGMAFSTGDMATIIIKGPLEAVLGIVYGIVFGIMIWYLPNIKHTSKTAFRFIMLFSAGLLAQFCSRQANISGAGPLGCLSLAFVAALRWRKEVSPGQDMPIEKLFSGLWMVFQPLLFGLIGAEINISQIELKTIGLGTAVLCIGLFLRMIASFLAVSRLGLNLKERLFIPLAWLPKATVQAAIGSIALDTARERSPPNPVDVDLGKQVLTIAVLVILITAPIGAGAIALAGPRLLQKRTPSGYEPNPVTADPPGEKTDDATISVVQENDTTVVYVL